MAACSAAKASFRISVTLSWVAAGFGSIVGAPSRNSRRLTRLLHVVFALLVQLLQAAGQIQSQTLHVALVEKILKHQ